MDTSWITLPNDHSNYIDGCLKFIAIAKESLVEEKTKCPCKNCKLRYWLPLSEVEGHILFKGFYQKYTHWIGHGKGDVLDHITSVDVGSTSKGSFVGRDNMSGLFDAANLVNVSHFSKGVNDELPHSHMKNSYIDDLSMGCSYNDDSDHEYGSDKLYADESHNEYNKPSKGNNIEEEAKYKRLFEAANKELYEGCQTFSKLSFILHLFHIKCMFHWPNNSFNKLIEPLLEAFPQIREFLSSYYEGKKLINNFGLGYEKNHACLSNCMLYWREFSEKEECHVCHTSRWKTSIGEGKAKKGEGAKVMRYFPLIPKLQRIYNSPKTAENMRWHHKDRVKDGKLRHPVDALAWEQFDSRYPEFASDPRSVRLALANDGFNPYRLMNTTYSTWPPLVYELELLWNGVDAFDAYEGKKFKLRASLYSTINDFPAYSMLSGWSTIGYDACPCCTHSTNSGRFGGKICYVGHRQWLDEEHTYRSQGCLFDGTTEYGSAPICATGSDVLRQQEGIDYIYGKSKKRRKRKNRARKVGESTNVLINSDDDNNDNLWYKKSVFFKLPYWEHNPLRHNLDVMHIEKNVCDNILVTLLDMDKSRDDENARKDLEKLGVKRHLWLKDLPNGGKYMPPASYSMSSEEKDRFLKVLQKNELNALQSKIILVLCQMEIEFLPTFFIIMVHLLIHLVEEVKLGGHVQYRWMYPIERYLAHLKSYVRNKSQPEGSIAEGYILEETIMFCSRYLEGVETIYNRSKRNDDVIQDMDCYLYQSGGRVIRVIDKVRLDEKSLKQAHRYVLLHSDEIKVVLE
ncbi:uncharacterized protein LOC141595055 [Silene latifolia]|uniref:uncharacterized protein LOC141595055 n=1 Tax=Silene latifolia TaxID=37657 RepID=UPI003D772129